MLLVLRAGHGLLDLAQVVGPLMPVTQAQLLTPLRAQGDAFAHVIKQQVDVGGEVHMGLNDKRVAAPTQGFFGPYLTGI